MQVGLLLTDWLVFSNFLCTGIELCKSAHSVPRQPFSALYARKAVAKGVPRFLNRAAKIESEMAISLCVCVKFSCADSCRYKLSIQATKVGRGNLERGVTWNRHLSDILAPRRVQQEQL